MNARRFHYVMWCLVGLLAIGVLASAFWGNAVLKKRSNKLVTLKTDNKVLDAQQSELVKAKKDIQTYAELQKEAQAIVPQDKDQAEAVREIVKIAGDSGISLSTITFPASTLGGTLGTGSTGSTSPNPAPKSSALTQVQPVKGIGGVYVMPITIQQDSTNPITYSNLIDFLSRLEQNRRTAQVASVTIQPAAQGFGKLTFNLVLNVYLKP